MATLTITPVNNTKVIKGQPFSVTAKIVGETGMIPGTTTVKVTKSTGATLLSTMPGLVSQGVFSQTLIFMADKNAKTCDIDFTTNTANHPKSTATYDIDDNPDFILETCILRGASVYLYDPNPIGLTGIGPTSNNPFISASINPTVRKSGPISNYEIPLRVTAPLRIYRESSHEEIFPYHIDKENSYYYYLIKKTSTEAVNLKIYATQDVHKFVELDVVLNDEEGVQQQVIFVTTELTQESDNLLPPKIEESMYSSTLTRPAHTDNFTFMIPAYKGAKRGDFVIGFVTDDKTNLFKQELFIAQITNNNDEFYKFEAPYSDLYSGDNHISYIALPETGFPARSNLHFITYDNGGINGPSSNDENRTLVEPEVYDQDGQFISLYDPINLYSIGQKKGLEIRLPSDPNDYDHTIAAGDKITITAYISRCIDTLPEKNRPLPITVLSNHIVNNSEISNGYFNFQLTADKLIGYAVADDYDVGLITIVYNRLAPPQKSKLYTRSFGTVSL
ncbi:hypothetical protein [Xenorhabdus thailandensis]|uniref:hypothetical protein n=1 Tax=Xenorhabdus thailandensis TaxID=3136255 RepID=UPI0030F371C2